MREDRADENSAGQKDDHNEEEPREVRSEQRSTTQQHVPRRIQEKTTSSEHAVAVTTQEALDGYRERTMRIANVKNKSGCRFRQQEHST